jgi:carbamate kinase
MILTNVDAVFEGCEAAAGFVSRGGTRAIIARLSEGPAALRGETGTTITRMP